MIKAASLSFRSPRIARALQLKGLQCTRLSSALRFHIINQITLLGYLGNDASTKNSSGTIITKFSVATKKSWKDLNDEWQEKSQWHQVVCFGENFEAMTSRLVKGAQVFVQGQLTTHEYDRTHKVPAGNGKVIEHVIKQLVVEVKADTIRVLDRSANTDNDAAESTEAP